MLSKIDKLYNLVHLNIQTNTIKERQKSTSLAVTRYTNFENPK